MPADPTTDAERLVATVTAALGDADPGEILYDLFDDGFQHLHSWTVTERRWGYREANVYRFPDGTHAAVEIERGATERHEPDPDATAYVVEPYEKTVTRYRKLEG